MMMGRKFRRDNIVLGEADSVRLTLYNDILEAT
jgi:hypothetical protein